MNYHRHNQNYKPERDTRSRFDFIICCLVLGICFSLFMWRL